MEEDEEAAYAAALLGLVSIEEAFCLVSRVPDPRPALSLSGAFNFNALGDGDGRFSFRFWKCDVVRLHDALGLEAVYKLPSRVSVTDMEALCVVLRRLAYPGRYGDLCVHFGRSRPALCMIFRFMIDLLYS
ncbi:hypothetical protein PF010_g20629, partial [Phytophthora fragariae]